jgi:hypothetical protein
MKKLLAVFDALKESKTTGEVDSLLEVNGIDKRFQFPIEKYPALRFKIVAYCVLIALSLIPAIANPNG